MRAFFRQLVACSQFGRCAAIGALLVVLLFCRSSPASINLVGLEVDLEHNSEYLFGFSGSSAGSLSLSLSGGGSPTLSTDFQQGWWSGTFSNSEGNTNYLVGDLSDNGLILLNNFFTFDIGSLTGQTVVSA